MKNFKKPVSAILALVVLTVFVSFSLTASAAANGGIEKVTGYSETQVFSFDATGSAIFTAGTSVDTSKKIEGAASGKIAAANEKIIISKPSGEWDAAPLEGGESFLTFWLYAEGTSRDEAQACIKDTQVILTDDKGASVAFWLKNNMYQSYNSWVYAALPLRNTLGLDPVYVLGKSGYNFGSGPMEVNLAKIKTVEFRKNGVATPMWVDDCKFVKSIKNSALSTTLEAPAGLQKLFGITTTTHWATVPTTINSPTWGPIFSTYSQESTTVGVGLEGKSGPNDIQMFGQAASVQALDTGIGGLGLTGGDPNFYASARNLFVTADVYIGDIAALDVTNCSLILFGNQNDKDDSNNMTFYLTKLKQGWNKIILPFNYTAETTLHNEGGDIVRKGSGPVNADGFISIGGARWLFTASKSTQMIINNFGVYYRQGQIPDEKTAPSVGENNGAKLTINWQKADNNLNGTVNGYIIVRDYYDDAFEDYINPKTFTVAGASTTSFTDTTVEGETKYRYKVYAVEDIDSGTISAIANYAEIIVTTPVAPDPPPADLPDDDLAGDGDSTDVESPITADSGVLAITAIVLAVFSAAALIVLKKRKA